MRVTTDATVPDPLVFLDSFDDLNDWTTNDMSVVSDRSFDSGNAAYAGAAQTGQPQGYRTVTPGQYGFFEFYYQETTSSTGGGVRLLNSNGDVECGFATDNPEWDYDSGNGITQDWYDPASDYYDAWHRVRMWFDWTSSQFTLRVIRLDTGYQQETTVPLRQGVDIARVNFDEYNGGEWQPGSDIDMWIDEMSLGSTELEVTVNEDPDGDGTAENTNSQVVSDGQNTYELGGFDETLGNDVWVTADLTSPNPRLTPELNSVTVEALTTFSGTVDLNGSLLEGATVYAINRDTDELITTTMTDSNGEYSFEGPPGTPIHVTAQFESNGDTYRALTQPEVID